MRILGFLFAVFFVSPIWAVHLDTQTIQAAFVLQEINEWDPYGNVYSAAIRAKEEQLRSLIQERTGISAPSEAELGLKLDYYINLFTPDEDEPHED